MCLIKRPFCGTYANSTHPDQTPMNVAFPLFAYTIFNWNLNKNVKHHPSTLGPVQLIIVGNSILLKMVKLLQVPILNRFESYCLYLTFLQYACFNVSDTITCLPLKEQNSSGDIVTHDLSSPCKHTLTSENFTINEITLLFPILGVGGPSLPFLWCKYFAACLFRRVCLNVSTFHSKK